MTTPDHNANTESRILISKVKFYEELQSSYNFCELQTFNRLLTSPCFPVHSENKVFLAQSVHSDIRVTANKFTCENSTQTKVSTCDLSTQTKELIPTMVSTSNIGTQTCCKTTAPKHVTKKEISSVCYRSNEALNKRIKHTQARLKGESRKKINFPASYTYTFLT